MVGNDFRAKLAARPPVTGASLAAQKAVLEELGAFLVQTRRAINLLELEFARAAGRFAAAQDPPDLTADDNPVQFMREECRMTSHAARAAINVGEFESQLEGSIDALTKGEIGIAHLGWMADTAQRLAAAEFADPFDETCLLESAKRLTVQRFRRECHHLVHAADHAGFVADQVRGVEARTLRMTALDDGAVHLDGYFDAEGGAIIRAAIEPLARRDGSDDHREVRQQACPLTDHALEIPSGSLLTLNGLEQRLEVALAESLASFALDDFEE